MRVVGGRLRGRQIEGPDVQSAAALRLRPTSDRVRESLFNILDHGWGIEGRRALDLFAGTGALGIEALSRGAVRCFFIEENPEPRALIRRNIETLGLIGESKIYRRDARTLGQNHGEPFDLIFLDPPYGQGLGEAALRSAQAGGWIAPGAVITLEETLKAPEPAVPGLTVQDRRTYGDTQILIFTVE